MGPKCPPKGAKMEPKCHPKGSKERVSKMDANNAFLGTVLGYKMGPKMDPQTTKKSAHDKLKTNTRKVTEHSYNLAPSGKAKTSKSTIRSSKIEVLRLIKTPAKLKTSILDDLIVLFDVFAFPLGAKL